MGIIAHWLPCNDLRIFFGISRISQRFTNDDGCNKNKFTQTSNFGVRELVKITRDLLYETFRSGSQGMRLNAFWARLTRRYNTDVFNRSIKIEIYVKLGDLEPLCVCVKTQTPKRRVCANFAPSYLTRRDS